MLDEKMMHTEQDSRQAASPVPWDEAVGF